MTRAVAEALFARWRSAPVVSVRAPAAGTINDIRIIGTASARYVLRIYRHRDHGRLMREHAVVDWVHRQGIESAPPVQLPDGATCLRWNGRLVTLLPLVAGVTLARQQCTPPQVAAMGALLARLHRVLADCPVQAVAPLNVAVDPAATLATIARLVCRIEAMPDPGPSDRHALHDLRTRRKWLEANHRRVAFTAAESTAQIIHGDYQESNILFASPPCGHPAADATPCAVIDWDKICRAPRGWEVVRALDLMLGFAADQARAFLAGYREVLPLDDAELDAAAGRYAAMRVHDLWVFSEIYDAGNARARQFLRPGGFRFVGDRWRALRRHLS